MSSQEIAASSPKLSHDSAFYEPYDKTEDQQVNDCDVSLESENETDGTANGNEDEELTGSPSKKIGKCLSSLEIDPNRLYSLKMLVANDMCGHIIGKQGKTINTIEAKADARIHVASDTSVPEGFSERLVTITGTVEAVSIAQFLVSEFIYNAVLQKALKSTDDEPVETQQDNCVLKLLIPETLIGVLIGKNGSNMNEIQAETGSKITITPESEARYSAVERVILLTGTLQSNKECQLAISRKLSISPLTPRSTPERTRSVSFSSPSSVPRTPMPATNPDFFLQAQLLTPSSSPCYISHNSTPVPYGIAGRSPSYPLGIGNEYINAQPNIGMVHRSLPSQHIAFTEEQGAKLHEELNTNPHVSTESLEKSMLGMCIQSSPVHVNSKLGALSQYGSLEYNSYWAEPPYSLFTVVNSSRDFNSDFVAVTALIPTCLVGYLIGKGGATIREIQSVSGALVDIVNSFDTPMYNPYKAIALSGMTIPVQNAQLMIVNKLQEACYQNAMFSAYTSSETPVPVPDLVIEEDIVVESSMVGYMIGKGGATINDIQQQANTKITVSKPEESETPSDSRTVRLKGTRSSIEYAEQLIRNKIAEGHRASRDARES
eukprot:Nk52_evm85s1810 gene=Nk52_evmTU85s1810